jgi:hypothetical protein
LPLSKPLKIASVRCQDPTASAACPKMMFACRCALRSTPTSRQHLVIQQGHHGQSMYKALHSVRTIRSLFTPIYKHHALNPRRTIAPMSKILKKPVKLASGLSYPTLSISSEDILTPPKGADKNANLTNARTKVIAAATAGAEIVVLPECFNSPYGCNFFPSCAETLLPSPPTKEQSPSFHALSSMAR